MTILTKDELLAEIKKGRMKITPFSRKNVGPASIDMTLGNEFRTFKKINRIHHLTNKTDYKKITELKRLKDNEYIVIMPGESLHAITKERIKLPGDLCGWIQGRSRFARMGLMVHITASFMQPGVNNRQVLEMFNASPIPLSIRPGLRVCQILFERCEGSAIYKGRFKSQKL